ncbi:Flp pilus assembly protein CpaB [Alcanivorax sp. S6407]|uniref:Flp pilus assembly protein CpaB n=1 Tax=Alcanivorax sp. S6407 TaxID=2926424 RepID=UPI001FF260A7|nr:Flp pilus assembly protein CpaB [Alcanivorax sp. S6407]MCK0153943.1 Flp pilus assembly protein CpaB [Alcanivorax sp. S6407]
MKKYAALIMLVVAVGLSALAGWLGFSYLEQRETALRQELNQMEQPVTVVVAKSDLYPGDVIGSHNMAVMDMPGQYLPSGVIVVDAFGAVEGLRLKVPMRSGSPLIQAFVAGAPGSGSFAELLRPGERAVTLEADPLKSIEGMINSGDSVDLVLLLDSEESDVSDSPPIINLLDNATVLATGVRTLADVGQQGDGTLYNSITLGIPVDKIQSVLTAEEKGEVFFLLRHPDDTGVARFGDELGNGNGVEIIAGGRSNGGVLSSSSQVISRQEEGVWQEQAAESGRVYSLARHQWDDDAQSSN